MNKLKVFTLVGTRPEIIKLSRVIPMLDAHTHHILAHTGQNFDYELNEIFFKDLSLRNPDYYLSAGGKSASETIAKVIAALDPVLKKEKPDAFLLLGDTNSAFGAIVAKKHKIPIFHMEAGNRCFDMRVPEEVNRKIIDHISDINMPYTDIARDYLVKEGIQPNTIIKTGSPMKEVLNFYADKIDCSSVLKEFKLKKNLYFLVSSHREENIENNKLFKEFISTLDMLASKYDLPIIVSTHPRMRKKLDLLKISLSKNIHFMKPFGFSDYIALMKNSLIVLSDSGTITEEASILKIHAINIRETHERPEGAEQATCIFTGMSAIRIEQALNCLLTKDVHSISPSNIVSDYNVDNVSSKVLKTILSYVDYVNRYSWRKIP